MKKAIILCSLDAFANAVKPQKLKTYLEKNNFEVSLFSTQNIGRLGNKGILRLLPGLKPAQLKLYCFDLIDFAADKLPLTGTKKSLKSYATKNILVRRGKLLHKLLDGKNIDLLICENNTDQMVVAGKRLAKIQILDLPAPFAEELWFGGLLTKSGFESLKKQELIAYKSADYLSFHWHTYAGYVQKNKYNGTNFIDLGYGTDSKTRKASFSEDQRIICLGYLSGYWVNLPLLERLCKMYSKIDVYGGPPPPKNFKINYKGYAPTLDIMAAYQFGLITITDDPLRRSSFSSKQLEYMSYGLPVLTPAWRPDNRLSQGSIYYDENNFLNQIAEYSNIKSWSDCSRQALNTANKLSWEAAFKPLQKIIALLKD